MTDRLADFLDRPIEDAAYTHPILQIGEEQWLVVGEAMKQLIAPMLPPGQVWTLAEIRSLPWPTPPSLRMVRAFLGIEDG